MRSIFICFVAEQTGVQPVRRGAAAEWNNGPEQSGRGGAGWFGPAFCIILTFLYKTYLQSQAGDATFYDRKNKRLYFLSGS